MARNGQACRQSTNLDRDGRCRWHRHDGVMSHRGPDAPQLARQVLTHERVLELRRTGMSLTQMSKALGCAVETVRGHLHEALRQQREHVRETALEVLQLELSRLDEMQLRAWPEVIAADSPTRHHAIASVLRIMDRRAKLLGLDRVQVDVNARADVQVSVTGVDLSRMTDDDLRALEALLRKYGEKEPIDV